MIRGRVTSVPLPSGAVDVRPYSIADLYEAAPTLDALNALAAVDTVDAAATAEGIIAFLAIGLARAVPGLTAEALGDGLTVGEALALKPMVRDILVASGARLSGDEPPIGRAASATFEEQLDQIVFELVAAGIEGGCRAAIEERWSLADVTRLRRVWSEQGPPLHVGVTAIAAGLGIKLTGDAEPQSPEILEGGVVGPSVQELAALMQVGAGCDTREASRLIAGRMLSVV